MLLLRRCAKAVLRRLYRLSWVRRWRSAHRPRVEVREATGEEWAALASARAQAGVPVAALTTHTPFVAAAGERVIGSVVLARLADEQGHVDHWLFALLVDDDRWRGLGVGELLTRAVLDRASADGADRVYLYVVARNVVALRLYQKLGFDPVLAPPPTAPDLGAQYLLLGCRLAEAGNAPGGAEATP